MRKTSTKLQLKANTIRVLGDGELAKVNGGAPSNDPKYCRLSLQCLGGGSPGGEQL